MNNKVSTYKRIIGVTGNHNARDHDWDEFMRDYSPHGYSKSLTMAGHMPIIIPLQEDLALAEQYVAKLDGLYLLVAKTFHLYYTAVSLHLNYKVSIPHEIVGNGRYLKLPPKRISRY